MREREEGDRGGVRKREREKGGGDEGVREGRGRGGEMKERE